MPSYVVITDNTGAALGEGPIYRATRWTAASRLDRTARCSFEVPAADPRAQDLLQNKRWAYYYSYGRGESRRLGPLIIDKIETVVEGRAEPMLRVSGDNLLADLATRSVHGLELYDTEAHTAHSVAHTYLDGGEYVTTDMDTAYDGDGGTTYSLDTGLDVDNYLYVCGESKVSGVWIAFGAGVNSNAATITAQYWNGSEWASCVNVNDTTADTGRTFFQNGGVFFDRPRDQAATTHNGVEGYWIRLTPSADLSDGIIIGDVSVEEDIPTAGGLAAIMACAPPGWTIATSNGGYAATKNTAYMQFAGETVLEALTMLAEHTGEHFRLGVGQSIDWLQDDPREAPVDSGVYAVQFPTASTEACAILELAEARDSYDLASRVYPYGARQGSARVTLAACTETPPAGFTLSNETIDGATYHYLKADNAENTIGRIDAVREWPEVGLQDDDAYHAVLAANALYQVALEWLQRYSQVHYAYTLRVAHLEREVWPGETVRVTYRRHRDGERYIDIDGAMVVLGVEMVEDGAGIRTTALEIASTDAWPLSGAEFMVREIRSARRARAGHASSTTLTDTIVSSNVNIDGGTIDNTPIGSNVPASGVFTTLHATENITTDGTVDGVDVAAHASNDSAHHDPVTVGNTGLSLSTQQLSLRLATVSGLSISSGLRLADSVAGAGLSITNKVLAVGAGDGIDVSANAIAVDVTDLIGSGLVEEATNNIALNTPGTLSVSSPNAAAGNHTHAVTALASTMSGEEALLKSSEAGGLALASLQTSGAADVGQGLTAGGSGFRVIHHTHDYPHVHVVVNPGPYWNLDEQFGVDIDDSLLVRGYIVGKHALQIKDARMILHFDGPEPYETNFTGNAVGHMGQVADLYPADGGLVYRPGLFGKAAQIGAGTTNLVDRPSLESADTTGWGAASSSTLVRTSQYQYIGNYSMRVFSGGTDTYAQASYGDIAVSNQSYTFSAYILNFTLHDPTGAVQMMFYWSGGANPAAGTFRTVGTIAEAWDEWTRFSITDAPDYADRTSVRVYLRVMGVTAPNQGFFTDCWQVEANAWPTPYCDGSMGAGHAWTGTPHASTSTRKGVRVTYDKVVPRDKFTVFGWFSSAHSENGSGDQWCPKFLDIGEYYGNPNVAVGKYGAATNTGTYFKDWNDSGWTDGTHGIDLNYKAGDWIFLAVVWDGSVLRVYGALLGDTAFTSITLASGDGFGAGDDLPLILGHSSKTGALYDDIAVVHRAMTEDELRAVYESNAPVFAETSTWHWRAGRNLVWADSEGFWAVDQTGDPVFAISGVNGKSWGGTSLDAGDVFIGNVTQGHYLHWDDSASKLTIRGDVAITGSVSVAWDKITNKPDGAGRLGTGSSPGAAGLWLTGSRMGYYNGSAWPVWIDNQGRFTFGNSTGTQYVKWDGSTFEVKGQIVVTGGSGIGSFSDAGALAEADDLDDVADGSTYGKLRKTIIGGGYIQVGSGTKDSTLDGWHIGSAEIVGQLDGADQVVLDTSGRITAGAGKTVMDVNGVTLDAGTVAGTGAAYSEPGTALKWMRAGTSTKVGSVYGNWNVTLGVGALVLDAQYDASNRAAIALYGTVAGAYIRLSGLVSIDGGLNVTGALNATGGLNVGTATGAAAGSILASGGIGANFGGTPGVGDICAGGNMLAVGGKYYFGGGTYYIYESGGHLYWSNGAVRLD